MAHWLLKTEPASFSIDDLARKEVEHWDGVRAYAARNNLMAMRLGDLGFFYHSSAEPPGVAGICEVVREFYPDHTQFDPASDYYDPKSREDNPTWTMVDLKAVEKLKRPVTLDEIKKTEGLEKMALVRIGRLSVSPVTPAEYKIIRKLADKPEKH